ncbi:FG-GAP repeat domain-containing protein [Jannaschia donghaensis]|uniref:FG-GAP repeat domain-containing protein n=1 Tax=Jannaschia donghaensis TaxID=420998 RepID=UPI001FE0F92D|nr:VCBS repeat-containing protein [Jannaschia donghaensis]
MPGSLVFSETTSPFTTVWYADASDSYGHGIMGDVLDGKTLGAQTRRMASLCFAATVSAGANHVFEDIAPRLTDVDGDGRADIVAVRSSFAKGAQLVVYTLRGDALEILAATPYIGQRHRWLAPAAIGDLDGDGHVEIAYVDRPHLAKTLRIWRYANGDFREVASAGGLTNHAIGDEVIHGGLRDCGQGPEIVLSNADRTRMLAVTYDGADIAARDIGPFSPAAAVRAVACQ